MNALFHDIVVARIESVVREARAVAKVSHPGVKGRLREILVGGLFRPLLPSDLGVGQGLVVSAFGQTSSEQDIVVYNRRLLPPLLYEGSLGIFPIDCCIATVEVKSQLTLGELRDADRKAAELQEFVYQSGPPGSEPTKIEPVISTVFALGTDLTGKGMTEFERYKSMSDGHPEALHAMCIVDSGYWFREHGTGRWKALPRSFLYAEVAGFLAGMLEAFARIAASRPQSTLVNYWFQPDESEAGDPIAVPGHSTGLTRLEK